jgi:putative ABC transport system substrate-binding protein
VRLGSRKAVIDRKMAMKRRELIAFLLGMTAGWPGAAAQVAKRRPLVAFLSGLSPERATVFRAAFIPRLQELGYVAGRDIDIVFRYADGDQARIPPLVDELLGLKPDVMVAGSGDVARVMRRATAQIPIVSAILGNPNIPDLGLVAPHARPEGNVTGILNNVDSLASKMIELAAEIVRCATRMGALYVAGFQQSLIDLKNIRDAAAVLGIEIVPVGVAGAGDLEAALQMLARERVHAVLVFGHLMILNER